jgi:SAM-dependent methyltransferase
MDTVEFHDFERTGWERAAGFYGDAFGELTAQMAAPMLDAVQAGPGTRLLDVATGPGFIAGAAAERGSAVSGLDFAAAMVAAARRNFPAIDFREGDAQALPFDASSFDAVVMNFGMLHLAQPDRAIAEARRVLRPGGRYAFTVWAAPERAIGFGLTLNAIETLGNTHVPLPEGPPFFRFSDAAQTRATLEAAGFADVEVLEVPLTWRVADAGAVFEAMSRGGVRTAAVLRAQTPDALAAIRAALTHRVEAYARDGAFVLPMAAVLASCRKP